MEATVRVRSVVWVATGVVVTLLATVLVMQQWKVDAAPGDSDATWVPIEPCRLFDYRSAEPPAGGKKDPLTAGAAATQQVTGKVGNCSIPTVGVQAVSMNVTVVGGTAQSNLRLYPADAAKAPLVSNMNWKAGASPVANKVDVKLSSTGAVKLLNFNGSVNVIGDVVGYYTNTTLKELAVSAGVPGPAGATGPRGFSAWDTIPSGVTVTGSMIWDSDIIRDNADHRIYVAFPAKASAELTNEDINFSNDGNPDTTDDDATCTGTVNAPTAPAGKVCLYRSNSGQIDGVNGRRDFMNSRNGFFVSAFEDGTSGDAFLYASWAYTAP